MDDSATGLVQRGGGGGEGGGGGGGDTPTPTANNEDVVLGVFFARTVAGSWAGIAVTCVVVVSSFGGLNASIYLGARQFYAAARDDGVFPAVMVGWCTG